MDGKRSQLLRSTPTKIIFLRCFHDDKVETMPLKTTESMEETITEWQQDKYYE